VEFASELAASLSAAKPHALSVQLTLAVTTTPLHLNHPHPDLLSAKEHRSSHSSSSFRSQAMHPPPPSLGPPPEGRDWRGRKTMKETMRVLTITELMRLTRTELCALLTRITNDLPALPEGSVERVNAHVNVRNIRYVLSRRDLKPG
jgi:hypothetical protein